MLKTWERLLLGAPFAVVRYAGPRHRAVFSNGKHDEMTGGRVVVGQELVTSIPELAGQSVVLALDRVYATGTEEHAREVPAQLRRGGVLRDCWFDVTWQATRDPDGAIDGVLVTAIEATTNVLGRRALEEARSAADTASRLALVLTSSATIGLVMTDVRGRCKLMNPAAEHLLGFTLAELVAMDRPLRDVVHGRRSDDDAPSTAPPLPESGHDMFVHRDGTEYPVAFTITPIFEDGAPFGTVMELDDLSEVRALEAAVVESERHFRELVDNLPELAWSARADGFIDFCNRRWYEYTGKTFAQMEGWGWTSVHSPAMLDEVTRRWADSIATGEPFEMEFPLRRADGVFRWFLTRVQPLRDARARVVRWIGTNTDIDDARRAAAERERLVDDLQSAVAIRDEFLSIAAHELRTPLTSLQLQVQSAIHLLERLGGPGATKIVPKLEVASRQTQHLAHLVDGLLDVSRSSIARVTLERAELDLVELARDVVERSAELAAAAGCALDFRADPTVIGSWDGARIGQVVTNLLANAIKYGAGQPIEVSVHAAAGFARIVVRDHGIGIAPADLERIFLRFERAVSSDHYGGIGLGLYIVRQIVDAHDGTIEVASEIGHGSVFIVSLCARPALESHPEEHATA